MFILLIRTIILYILVVLTMRLMGKKQIGQMQPFELVIAIMISELASLPMQDTRISLLHGIVPILTLLALQTSISYLQLKSEKIRGLFCSKPSILINNGKIDINELHKQSFTINDLMEELRLLGYFNLQDIQYAILEDNGQLSVIGKTGLDYVTKDDMKIKYSQEVIPITLILDGRINYDSLKIINKDEKWLLKELEKHEIESPKDIFIALLDSQKKFYYQIEKGVNLK
ncbi:MAG TPA: DUF421 domain-containing protein [Clostridiaceae bacterium]